MSSRRRAREAARSRNLLRRVDLEEVLDALGIEVLWYKGSDAYAECPDPEHDDADPSFHVCVEDVVGPDGVERLGAFNCWSHPEDGLSGANFFDLAARVLYDLWGERFPGDADRDRAAAWIRETFLAGRPSDFEAARARVPRRREDEEVELVFPPSRPVRDGDPRFLAYLERRGISLERAEELDVRAVSHPGRRLRLLDETVPAVLFPIRDEDGEAVNWFARSISRFCRKRDKGRYAPVPLATRGVLWAPDGIVVDLPVTLVEGIFDAERVRRVVRDPAHGLAPRSVAAVLGGRLRPEQARRFAGVPEVALIADGDPGGETLAASASAQLKDVSPFAVRRLPEGSDPDDAPLDALLRALAPGPAVSRRPRRKEAVETVAVERPRVRRRRFRRAVRK